MAESNGFEDSARANEKEDVKQLMRGLEGWREILLPVYSVFIWDQPYYPGVIAGAVSFLFLLIWYCDLSVLTTLSLIGLLASLLDYAVPLLSTKLFDPEKWTGTQQRHYEDICQNLVQSKRCFSKVFTSVKSMKEERPKVYFVVVLVTLILLAWIGNTIDNLFLTYLIVLTVAMVPGMKRNGTINKLVSQAALALKNKFGKDKQN